jgi:hypothetical protein
MNARSATTNWSRWSNINSGQTWCFPKKVEAMLERDEQHCLLAACGEQQANHFASATNASVNASDIFTEFRNRLKRIGTVGSPLRSLFTPPQEAGCYLDPIVSEMRLAPNSFVLIRCIRCLAPPPSVVHADQGSARLRVGVEETTPNRTGTAKYSMIVLSEVHPVAFQKHRPAPREHPFSANTGSPTCSGPIEAAKVKTI